MIGIPVDIEIRDLKNNHSVVLRGKVVASRFRSPAEKRDVWVSGLPHGPTEGTIVLYLEPKG